MNEKMLHVLTNSSTCFGMLVICVSRSDMCMTFTPSSFASIPHLRRLDGMVNCEPLTLLASSQSAAFAK